MATDESSNTLPSRDILAKRIEAQRDRVFHAQAICGVTSAAARSGGGELSGLLSDVWVAMEAVSDLLDDVAGKLEADAILERKVRPDEQDELEEARP